MKLKCDNCGRAFSASDELEHVFPDIPDLLNRLDPGGTVPNGTCPECGSLVYITSKEMAAEGQVESVAVPNDAASEREFRVEWSIDIYAADFRQAAERALRTQRKRDSTATAFDVTCSATGIRQTVDLLEPGNHGEVLCCRVCGDRVEATRLRDHLCQHSPNADSMDWKDVRDQFAWAEARDWIDEFAGGAAKELIEDGMSAEQACCFAGQATAILREHEARETGKEVH